MKKIILLLALTPLLATTPLENALIEVAGDPNVELTPLDGGMTSSSLYTFSEKYVAKVLHQKYTFEQRSREIQAHKIAAEHGLAPKLIYEDPEAFVIVMPLIKGHTLNQDDLENPEIVARLGQMARILHDHSGFQYRRTQVDRAIKHYNRAHTRGTSFPTVYHTLYRKFIEEAPYGDEVFCHGDLNPANILVSDDGEVYFIDWAGATLENRYAELGYLTFLGGFSQEQSEAFLSAYLNHKPTQQELQKLDNAQRRIPLLTAIVWFDFSESPEDKNIPISKRTTKLNTLLNSPDLKTGRDYIQEGITVSPTAGQHKEIKLYAMGFLKTHQDWDAL